MPLRLEAGGPEGSRGDGSTGRRPPWRRPGLVAWGLAAALLFSAGAHALPRAGEALPSFSAKDLTGDDHSSRELQGQRTLVVAMTDRNAGDAMQRWFDAADARLGKGGYTSTALISLRLPFFVSGGAARDKAKQRVPREFWEETWLDRDGGMARALGLASSRDPFVLVVDARGRVLASLHGLPDSPEAGRIWSALQGR